jgi:hypothetical protein
MKILKTSSWHFKFNRYVSNRQLFENAFKKNNFFDYLFATTWNVAMGAICFILIGGMGLGVLMVPIGHFTGLGIPLSSFYAANIFVTFVYGMGVIIWSGVILLLALTVFGFVVASISKLWSTKWIANTKTYSLYLKWKNKKDHGIKWLD